MANPNQQVTFNGGATVGAMTFGAGSPAYGRTMTAVELAEPSGDEAGSRVAAPSRTLIVVVADVERRAVLDQVLAASGTAYSRRHLRHHTIYDLGRISATEVMLAQVGQGTVTPDAAGVAASQLVEVLRPDHLILTGICYGLKDDDPSQAQRLGDVVVASQLRLIGHKRITQLEGHATITDTKRGGEVHPSPMLLDRFHSASLDWKGQATVHFGPVLSESVLVDSRTYRQHLKEREPEAIAGEMEGSGIYAAALRGTVNWGLVKGICDWGYDKGYDHQRTAADNAVSLVVHVISVGGLDPVRSHDDQS